MKNNVLNRDNHTMNTIRESIFAKGCRDDSIEIIPGYYVCGSILPLIDFPGINRGSLPGFATANIKRSVTIRIN